MRLPYTKPTEFPMRSFLLLSGLLVACTPDADGDGFDETEDCNDEDPSINPDAVDTFFDDIDDDCDGTPAIPAYVGEWALRSINLALDGQPDPFLEADFPAPGASIGGLVINRNGGAIWGFNGVQDGQGAALEVEGDLDDALPDAFVLDHQGTFDNFPADGPPQLLPFTTAFDCQVDDGIRCEGPFTLDTGAAILEGSGRFVYDGP